MSWLSKIFKILMKNYQKYPSMASYRVIQSFNQTTSQISYGHENISNPITYLYVSWLKDDDSVDDALETSF